MNPISIVSTAERPDLVPVVAEWLWTEFWRRDGYAFEDTLGRVNASVTAWPLPRTFILLRDGEALGTASLVAHDLEERPELTPWLAGVFVVPHARGRGYVRHLMTAVEEVCRSEAIPTLWLYTRTAEQIYARAGWQTIEPVRHSDRDYVLMRRQLVAPDFA